MPTMVSNGKGGRLVTAVIDTYMYVCVCVCVCVYVIK